MVSTSTSILVKSGKVRREASSTQVVFTVIPLVLVLGAILAHFLLHPLKIAPQPALFIEYGKLILDGQQPYLQFFDYVFPPVMYLYCVPNLVSNYFSIHPIQACNLCVWGLLIVSLTTSGVLLFKSKTREQSLSSFFLVGFAVANLVFIEQFGQPHHLMLLFCLPYFISRVMGKEVDIRLLGITGFLAAIGFCLDLLFLVVFLSFEILLSLHRKTFKTMSEVDFSSCFVTLIIIGILFISQCELSGVLYANLPFTMMLLDYDTWNSQMGYIQTTPDLRMEFYFTIVVLSISLGMSKWSKFLFPLNLLIVIGFGVFVLQGKMRTYQGLLMFVPAIICLSIICGIAGRWLISKLKSEYLVFGGAFAAVVVSGFSLFYIYNQYTGVEGLEQYSLEPQGYRGNALKKDLSIFHDVIEKHSSVNEKIMILNDQVVPAYPLLLQMGRKSANGFLTARLLKMTRRARMLKPVETWRHTAVSEENLYKHLRVEIKFKSNRLILVNKDTMGLVLDEKKITPLIKENYDLVDSCDWYKYDWKTIYPDLEYLGYKTALEVYKAKDLNP